MPDSWPATVRQDEIQVHVKDGRYSGWKSVRVTRPLDALAGSFKVEYPVQTAPLPIEQGDPVKVWLDDQLLINGHVERLQGTLDGTYSISGRDVTGDLVDCTAENQPGQWIALTIEELVDELCKPFSIPVRLDDTVFPEPAPIYEFALQNEKAGQAIERACRMTGVLAYTRGDGQLSIIRPGRLSRPAQVDLVEGENLLAASLDLNSEKRFRTYRVQAQQKGSDSSYGDAVTLVTGLADDPAVSRYRPVTIDAEGPATFHHAQERAEWEATIRAARSARMNVTVQGFRQKPNDSSSRPWAVGELVKVRSAKLRMDAELLVNRVRFHRDTGGSTTELELIRRDAYTPEPRVSETDDPFAAFAGGG